MTKRNEKANKPPVDKALARKAFEAVMRAVRASQEGKPIEEKCVFCDGLLKVMPVPDDHPTQWIVSCPCGKSSTTIKGL